MANFWCALSVLVKVKNLLTQAQVLKLRYLDLVAREDVEVTISLVHTAQWIKIHPSTHKRSQGVLIATGFNQ